MENLTIPTDLAQILNKLDSKFDEKFNKLDSKFDKLSEDVNQLKVGQAKLTTKVENIEKEISEIKGAQNEQVWALIGIVFSAVGILGKIVFFPTT